MTDINIYTAKELRDEGACSDPDAKFIRVDNSEWTEYLGARFEMPDGSAFVLAVEPHGMFRLRGQIDGVWIIPMEHRLGLGSEGELPTYYIHEDI